MNCTHKFTVVQATVLLLLVCLSLCKANDDMPVTDPSSPSNYTNRTILENSTVGTIKEESNAAPAAISTVIITRPVIDKVYLWTKHFKNGQDPEVLNITDDKTFLNSSFVSGVTTFIAIHDFASHGLAPWITEAKDKLLTMLDCNVLSVSWQAGNASDNYTYYNVTPRVPVVGNETAMLLSRLHVLKQQSLDTVHLVGKGLGAHVAGAAARNSGGRVGRVTGLDPTGPDFETLGPNRRLDKSDAAFVDVIHTNGCNNPNKWMICFGIIRSIGHVDFYPNGGEYQPACDKAGKHDKRKPGCDHDLAENYFRESLEYGVTSTLFLARPAKNYYWYVHGDISCGPYPQYMGYHASSSATGNYYLNTTNVPPFACKDPVCPSRTTFNAVAIGIISSIAVVLVLVVGTVAWYVTTRLNRRRVNNEGRDSDPLLHREGEEATLGDTGSEGVLAAVARRIASLTKRREPVTVDV